MIAWAVGADLVWIGLGGAVAGVLFGLLLALLIGPEMRDRPPDPPNDGADP